MSRRFATFSLSSLVSFAIDATVLVALMAQTGNLAISVVTARVISAACNFATNRRLVFDARSADRSRAAVRYAVLATALLGANYVLLRLLTGPVGFALVPAKVLTETTLFLASYRVQSRVVFRPVAATTGSLDGTTGSVDGPQSVDHRRSSMVNHTCVSPSTNRAPQSDASDDTMWRPSPPAPRGRLATTAGSTPDPSATITCSSR